MAIGSGKVERVERLVKINLKRKGGIQALLTMHDHAARQVYHPKSYTKEDRLRDLLLWQLGGVRVVGIANRALNLPSHSSLCRHSIISPIVVSPSSPTPKELEANIISCFETLQELLETHNVVHQVLMFDELKIEERPRYDIGTNKIMGQCREHGKKTSLEYNSEKEVDLLLEALKKGEVHLATEATVGAIGILTENTRLYGARPVLVSGSCKCETGAEHMQLIKTTYDACKNTKLRTVCVSSDGKSRRGKALVQLTFKHTLQAESPIFDLLSPLPLMNMEVGDDDLTANKDTKHVIKRLRNLTLHEKGVMVEDVHIKTA
ncbi:hypothetical protein C0993_009871, partial [Termitomyces sp. T159_Od127]